METLKLITTTVFSNLVGKNVSIDQTYVEFTKTLETIFKKFDFIDWKGSNLELLLDVLEDYYKNEEDNLKKYIIPILMTGIKTNSPEYGFYIVQIVFKPIMLYVKYDPDIIFNEENTRQKLLELNMLINKSNNYNFITKSSNKLDIQIYKYMKKVLKTASYEIPRMIRISNLTTTDFKKFLDDLLEPVF